MDILCLQPGQEARFRPVIGPKGKWETAVTVGPIHERCEPERHRPIRKP